MAVMPMQTSDATQKTGAAYVMRRHKFVHFQFLTTSRSKVDDEIDPFRGFGAIRYKHR
jgi:hypothetical protein